MYLPIIATNKITAKEQRILFNTVRAIYLLGA